MPDRVTLPSECVHLSEPPFGCHLHAVASVRSLLNGITSKFGCVRGAQALPVPYSRSVDPYAPLALLHRERRITWAGVACP